VAADAIAALRQRLVLANRILVQQGVLDGFGHVSARHPHDPGRFLLARRLTPALVRPDDILEFGMDGETVESDAPPGFLERYIHSSIYSFRPDVAAVVHSHSPAMVTLSIVRDVPLRAVCHTCGFLGDGAPLFEIRDSAGDGTNLLISGRGLGDDLARVLGDASVVQMRGHGFTAVGGSVEQAVYRAVYSELNARIQSAASMLGEVTYLTDAEARAADDTADLQVARTWAYWRDLVGTEEEARA